MRSQRSIAVAVVVSLAAAVGVVGASFVASPPSPASQWPCGPGPPPDPEPIGPAPYDIGGPTVTTIGGETTYNFTVYGTWCEVAWSTVSFTVNTDLGGPAVATDGPGWNLTIHSGGTLVATYDISETPGLWIGGGGSHVQGGETILLLAPSAVPLSGDTFTAIINPGPHGGSVGIGI